MMKKMFLGALALIILLGLNGCNDNQKGQVQYPPKIKEKIQEMNVKAAILVTADGQLLVLDDKGEPLPRCQFPEPGEEKADTKQYSEKECNNDETKCPTCKGLTKGSAVTSLQNLSILKSNIDNCYTIGPDASGGCYEICW